MRLPDHCPVLALPASDDGIDLQVGLARPVVLRGLGPRERGFVESLEGGAPVSPAQARRFARVVSLLTAGEAWEGRPRPLRAAAVAVHGAGALGMEIATMLARDGLDVALHDAAPPEVEPRGVFAAESYKAGVGTCAGAAAASLAALGVPVRIGSGGEALGVAVCLGAPDPVVTSAWMRADVPHVLAVCDGETVWVSHVVVPGVSACARCRDLALTRADPGWPSVVLQIGGTTLPTRRPVAPRLSLATAATRVASRIAVWLETGQPGCGERVDAHGQIATEPIEPSADCGCGAAGAIGDELAARRTRWVGADD